MRTTQKLNQAETQPKDKNKSIRKPTLRRPYKPARETHITRDPLEKERNPVDNRRLISTLGKRSTYRTPIEKDKTFEHTT